MDKVVSKIGRKEWRNLVKKLQRKRRRQTAARARDQKLEAEEAIRLRDPAHQIWLQYQSELEEQERLAAAQQHDEEEEAWLRRDLLAHLEFRREQQKRAVLEAEQEAKRLLQQQEYEEREAAKRRKQEEQERLKAAAAAEFEQTMKLMDEYLSSDDKLPPPASLCRTVESRPGQKPCEFFERLSCCRFGEPCVFNHRRPLLSTILLLRHFFVHSALEQQQQNEYSGGEAALESSERDLREDYDAFFADVVPEFEQFGKILNFRALCNVQKHLRGHVYVEYTEERSALKAFIKLQGRYYASRRLNIEFSKLKTWRGAICGLSLTRKCPKGNNCHYLHLFSNPDNKYNTLLEYTKPTAYSLRKVETPISHIATPTLSWDDVCASKTNDRKRNWRWSESPEVELQTSASNVGSSSNSTNGRNEHKNESHRRSERHSEEKNRYKRQHSSASSSSHQHKRKEEKRSDRSDERCNKNNSERRESNSHSKARSTSCSSSESKSSKREEDRSSKHLDKRKHESSNEVSRRRKNRSRSRS